MIEPVVSRESLYVAAQTWPGDPDRGNESLLSKLAEVDLIGTDRNRPAAGVAEPTAAMALHKDEWRTVARQVRIHNCKKQILLLRGEVHRCPKTPIWFASYGCIHQLFPNRCRE